MRAASCRAQRWTVLAIVSALVGCDLEESVDPAPPTGRPALALTDPTAPGPYHVGVTWITARYGDRELPVQVWYPAEVEAGEEATDYPIVVGVIELAKIESPLGAVRDAPLALEGAPHPAIVFSHGNAGFSAQSVYLTEQLASHGFVVAAPEHVGNSLVADLGGLSAGEAAVARPYDVSATLDALLEASAQWPGPLYLAADQARLGVAGHSFGAFTTLRIAGAEIDAGALSEACAADPAGLVCEGWDGTAPRSQRDERFRAALAQTPGAAVAFEPLEAGLAAIDIPMMIQGGTHDEITPYVTESIAPFEALDGPAYLLLIEGAGHFTFSDVCDLTDQLGLDLELLSNGCEPTDISPAQAHELAAGYATAFFQLHLVGETPSNLLSGAPPLPDEVAAFERK